MDRYLFQCLPCRSSPRRSKGGGMSRFMSLTGVVDDAVTVSVVDTVELAVVVDGAILVFPRCRRSVAWANGKQTRQTIVEFSPCYTQITPWYLALTSRPIHTIPALSPCRWEPVLRSRIAHTRYHTGIQNYGIPNGNHHIQTRLRTRCSEPNFSTIPFYFTIRLYMQNAPVFNP